MHRFKSILAVLDQDSHREVALARAIRTAQLNEARLTLVDIMESQFSELWGSASGILGGEPASAREHVLAVHREDLERSAQTARAAGLEVTEALLEGVPFIEVIRLVLREGHDLVVKGAARPAGPRAWFKGTDMHLMRKCPCPVWLLKDQQAGAFDRILACVDPGTGEDPQRDRLDRLVLDLAISLGRREGAEVDVVHAWHLPEEQALRRGRATSSLVTQIDRLVERERDRAEALVRRLMADYPQVPPDRLKLLKGPPGETIAEFAALRQSDLIVMGTVARTGISGLIMGNTAETILGQVSASVMAVKPEGFESPVTVGA